MTLREMVETLRISPQRVEIRDGDNFEIMTCSTDSQGIKPYLDMRVSEWFPGAAPERHCDFTVSLKVPKEQTQPKTGTAKWIIGSDGYYPYCSACKWEPKDGEMTDYCPHCGARMELE